MPLKLLSLIRTNACKARNSSTNESSYDSFGCDVCHRICFQPSGKSVNTHTMALHTHTIKLYRLMVEVGKSDRCVCAWNDSLKTGLELRAVNIPNNLHTLAWYIRLGPWGAVALHVRPYETLTHPFYRGLYTDGKLYQINKALPGWVWLCKASKMEWRIWYGT